MAAIAKIGKAKRPIIAKMRPPKSITMTLMAAFLDLSLENMFFLDTAIFGMIYLSTLNSYSSPLLMFLILIVFGSDGAGGVALFRIVCLTRSTTSPWA